MSLDKLISFYEKAGGIVERRYHSSADMKFTLQKSASSLSSRSKVALPLSISAIQAMMR